MTTQNSLAWQCQCFYVGRPDFGTAWGDPAICEPPIKNEVDFVCADNYADAYEQCGEICGHPDVEYALDFRIEPQAPIACTNNPASMSCTGWNPASNVFYSTANDEYAVLWTFISNLVTDPEPLWACDDAYFAVVSSSGGFEVADANSGELLYELGLRNGDMIVSLNDITINDHNDAAFAFMELWGEGETYFTLVIQRGTNNLELNYVWAVSK